MNKIKYLALLLGAAVLGGCAGNAQKTVEDALSVVAVESSGNETLMESEETEAFEESDEEYEEEIVTVEYVEWDGTGTIKKNRAAVLSDRQYFNGKTYVVDSDTRNLGAEFPVVPRKVGDQLVEPVISEFLLTEDKLFYLEKSPDVETHGWNGDCYDLYVQSLDTGEVRLLDTKVDWVVYQEGVVLCHDYVSHSVEAEAQDEAVRKIDVETGTLLDELNFETRDVVMDATKDYVMYYQGTGASYYYYYFETKTSEQFVFPEGTLYRDYFSDGNMYAKLDLENGNTQIVQLYEQGNPVYRIFSKEFSGDTYCSHHKVFYEENRKIMEYNLETGEDRYVCDLGENEYGSCDLYGVQESNGVVLLEEIGDSDNEYGVRYLYEVKDGVKTLVTDGFWIYG